MQTTSTKTATTSARGNPPDVAATPVWNWTKELVTYPQVVVVAHSVDDIVAIVRDRDKYPAPVRAHGSKHTTTACGEADGGTIVDMRAMDRVLRIEGDRVTAEAGAKYIDVAKELEKNNLQFFVNIELGNLSMGAAACTATKDASMPGEYGQVNSYCIGLKLVKASGDIVEITENDIEVLQAARSSYGMLGIVYEVTFKVKPLQAMKVKHELFSVDDFARRLPELIGRGQSMMMYVFPFLNRIVVELRSYVGEEVEVKKRLPASHFVWRLRNRSWRTVVPWLNHILEKYAPQFIRYHMVNAVNWIVQLMLTKLLVGENTIPTDQMIRYPAVSGASKYTFSIWAIAEDRYSEALLEYFRFAQEYYKENHWRPNMLHVGYRILQDQSSLFSYTYDGDVLTIDPVSTGEPGWMEFLAAYNEFCSARGGWPLLNQTPGLTRGQVQKAFGDRLDRFAALRSKFDPDDRFLNGYFRELIT